MRRKFTFFLVLISCLISASRLEAQTIEGKVYIDYNSNGQFDTTDFGYQGVQVLLYDGCTPNSPNILSVRTTATGSYKFSGLQSGSYNVKVNENDSKSPKGATSPSFCCLDIVSSSTVQNCDLGYRPPNCTSNPYSKDSLCEIAFDNPFCDLRIIGQQPCGQNPSKFGPWKDSLHCAGKYENTSFFSFIAGTGNYSIEIETFICAGTGIEYGIMDSCNPNGPYVVCNGNSNFGNITILCNYLSPGKTYVLWIDGFQGSVCSYNVSVMGDFNVFEAPPINDIEIETDCTLNCPQRSNTIVRAKSESNNFNGTQFDNVSLHWEITFPNDSTLNIEKSLDNSDATIDIPFELAGIYSICVRSYHPCSGFSDPLCKDFTFENLNDQYKSFDLCADDFPWNGEVDENGDAVTDFYGNQWKWIGGPITSDYIINGTRSFISTLENECGCQYSQVLDITYYEIGDTCDDGDPETTDDAIQDDCECRGVIDDGISDSETWFYTPFGLTPSAEIWKVLVVGDTIINENDFNHSDVVKRKGSTQKYKIIAIDKGQGIIDESKIPIARVDGKLYFYENGKQKLYFDFTKSENDTMIYFVPQVQPYYDISSNMGFTKPDSLAYSLIVDSTSQVNSTEGIKLPKVYTHTISDHGAGDNIQSVGGDIGFFGAFGPFLTAGFEGYLRCFQSDILNYNPLSLDCLSTSTDDEALDNPKLYIVPNPASDEISVISEGNEILDLQILNTNGFSIYNQLFLHNVSIDVSTWASGMYYILVKTKNDVTALKFIKVE